jgi:hypothetical protein
MTKEPVDPDALWTMSAAPEQAPPPKELSLAPPLKELSLEPTVREEDLSLERVTEEGTVREPRCRQEASAAGTGEWTRVIAFGKELEAAQDLTEVGLRLCRLGQQLLALQRAGWQLQAPMTGDDEVVIVRG